MKLTEIVTETFKGIKALGEPNNLFLEILTGTSLILMNSMNYLNLMEKAGIYESIGKPEEPHLESFYYQSSQALIGMCAAYGAGVIIHQIKKYLCKRKKDEK